MWTVLLSEYKQIYWQYKTPWGLALNPEMLGMVTVFPKSIITTWSDSIWRNRQPPWLILEDGTYICPGWFQIIIILMSICTIPTDTMQNHWLCLTFGWFDPYSHAELQACVINVGVILRRTWHLKTCAVTRQAVNVQCLGDNEMDVIGSAKKHVDEICWYWLIVTHCFQTITNKLLNNCAVC